MFHNFACFNQTCDQTLAVCGATKMKELFAEVLAVSGDKPIEYFEHVEVTYVKKDMSKVRLVITREIMVARKSTKA